MVRSLWSLPGVAKLNGEVLRAARYLTRKATGEELRFISSKEAFKIVQSKSLEGWDGVKKAAERMKKTRPDL